MPFLDLHAAISCSDGIYCGEHHIRLPGVGALKAAVWFNVALYGRDCTCDMSKPETLQTTNFCVFFERGPLVSVGAYELCFNIYNTTAHQSLSPALAGTVSMS
jgi:hypothetical protein